MSQDSTTRLREALEEMLLEASNLRAETIPSDTLQRARDALARPAPPASAGGEWVVVPREPTPSMLHYVIGDTVSEGRAYYAALLAAAPTPPATAGEE